MAKLTEEKIIQIQQLYAEIGIYSQVAKIVGCTAATVKKYCTLNVTPPATQKIVPFSGLIAPVTEDTMRPFIGKRAELLLLTDYEQSEIERLWEEI